MEADDAGEAEPLGPREEAERTMKSATEAVAEEARTGAGRMDALAAEAALPQSDEFSLSKEFYDAYKAYSCFLRTEEKTPEQSDLDELSTKLKAIAFFVTKLRLFSPNEELDDVSSADLKFLLLPFLLAEVAGACRDMDERLASVRRAVVYWRAFLHDCERLGLANRDDLRAVERDPEARLDAASLREEKIGRYRRGKELDQKVEYLFSKKKEALGDDLRWGHDGSFDEDMERELILALLGRAAASAVDNMLSALQELPMLEMMMARGGLSASAPASSSKLPAEKPFIIRIQDKAELMRIYREMVFECPFARPTMTLEEAADIEMAQAREATDHKNVMQARQSYEDHDRWYGGDRYGSKEDDDDEKKTYKDRDWDDWKDEHPWGSGNKMANVS